MRFLCGNDTVAVAMRFAMKNGKICFSLRKFLAISPAIQKIASDCGCDAVVHLVPENLHPREGNPLKHHLIFRAQKLAMGKYRCRLCRDVRVHPTECRQQLVRDSLKTWEFQITCFEEFFCWEGSTSLKTLTSLNKGVRPFFPGDNSIWSFPSSSSLSHYSIWRS